MLVAPLVSPRVIQLLRDATREHHAALDASVDVSTAEHYRRFLVASYAAVASLEPAIDPQTPRTIALREDLEELGLDAPAPLEPANLSSRDGLLGAAYVMEGSSLGGMVLAERVSSFTSATRYLRLRGKATAARWREFLATLERDVKDPSACCEGALVAFEHYRRAFARHGALA